MSAFEYINERINQEIKLKNNKWYERTTNSHFKSFGALYNLFCDKKPLKEWKRSDFRAFERAYSPKTRTNGYWTSRYFYKNIPKKLGRVIEYFEHDIIIVFKNELDDYEIMSCYNYEDFDLGVDGMVIGFPLRPWIKNYIPYSIERFRLQKEICRMMEYNRNQCESPIEKQFFDAATDRNLYLASQYRVPINNNSFPYYRLDFAIPNKMVGIELDGKDFHSSKEQIREDKIRENRIESKGWKILRFTGSEVYKDVNKCIDEVLCWVGEHPFYQERIYCWFGSKELLKDISVY